MSINQQFRDSLLGGRLLIGTMLTVPSPTIAEVLTDAGYDWLFVDAEHGPLEIPDILAVLQAVDHRIPCLVRVPANSEAVIKRVLDLGAAGIIVPQVNSAEQAEAVVRYAKYAPQGCRGVGLARAHGYGTTFQEYVQSANAETTVVVQAEHIAAVDDIERIAEVPGVDAVLIGPYDLSASIDKMGAVTDAEVLAAIERVTNVCREKKVALGYFGVGADAVNPYIEQGFRLITVGVDTLMLAQNASRIRGHVLGE